jgi:hypothetical protein
MAGKARAKAKALLTGFSGLTGLERKDLKANIIGQNHADLADEHQTSSF